MNIAIDARELQGKPTGVGRFLSELVAVWKTLPEAQAHEFMLLSPEGVESGTLWEQWDLPALTRRAGADVLFSPGYTGPIRPPVPMAVAIHDVSFAAHPEWFSWREGARRRTIATLAARAAARVITISEFSKREIAAYLGIDDSKIVVTYPGVSSFTGSANLEGLRHGGMGKPKVLFVGSIFNRRHVPELIDGFARLARRRPDVRLEIVGDNRTSPHINVQSLVRATGLADRIAIRSYVPDDELRSLYAESAAFAFLSEYEGFGLTPLEALAAGVPVLLLDTPVAREVCGDAARYVKYPDPALIEEGLAALLFDPATRQDILGAAPDILARYSWTTSATRVLRALVEAARA